MDQQQLDQMILNENIEADKKHQRAIDAAENEQRGMHQPHTSSGDYVKDGFATVVEEANIPIIDAAIRSIDTTGRSDATSTIDGAFSITQKDAASFSDIQRNAIIDSLGLSGMSFNELKDITEIFAPLDRSNFSSLSDDKDILSFLDRNIDDIIFNGGMIQVSNDDFDILQRAGDQRFINALDDNRVLKITNDDYDTLLRHRDYARELRDYNSYVRDNIDVLNNPGVADPSQFQEAVTFFDSASIATGRYKDAKDNAAKIRLELKQAKIGGADRNEIKRLEAALKEADQNVNNVLRENQGTFSRSKATGDTGLKGRLDLAYRAADKVMKKGLNESNDFAGKELTKTVSKTRRNVQMGKEISGFANERKLHNLDKKIEKNKINGKDDILLRNKKEAELKVAKSKKELMDAKRHGDLKEKKDAYEKLIDAKFEKRSRERFIKKEKKLQKDVKRIQIRERKKGEKSELDINKEVEKFKERKRTRDINKQNKRLKRHEDAKIRLNEKYIKDKNKETLKRRAKELRRQKTQNMWHRKLLNKLANSKIGVAVGSKVAALQTLRASIARIIAAIAPIIIMIVGITIAVVAIVTAILSFVFLIGTVFIGDDAENKNGYKNEDMIETPYAEDYMLLAMSIRQAELDWTTDIQNKATEAVRDNLKKIKKDIKNHGCKVYNEFDPNVKNGLTGIILDEYGNQKNTMGNYVANLLMAKYRVNTDLKNTKSYKKGNLDKVADYIVYLWSGDDKSDSKNWTNRESPDSNNKDKKNGIGRNRKGKVIIDNKTSKKNLNKYKYKEEYSYQNWDSNAYHWKGANHQVLDAKERETLYDNPLKFNDNISGKNYDYGNVITEKLGTNWFMEKLGSSEDETSIGIQYWHHSDTHACDSLCYHGEDDSKCDNYHMVTRYRSTKKGVVAYQVKVCDGHCPSHIVPIVDYKFIGKIENLAAFDGYPMVKMKTLSERWSKWWKSKATALAGLLSPELKEILEETKEVEDELSGESTWNHWTKEDVEFCSTTAGDYKNDYAEGRKVLKDLGIDIGKIEDGSWTNDEFQKMMDKYHVNFGSASIESMVEWLYQKCNDPDVVYQQGKGQSGYNPYYPDRPRHYDLTGNAYDCSSLVASAYLIIDPDKKYINWVPSSLGINSWAHSHGCVITNKVNLVTGEGLEPGDILWRSGHVEMYVGNGKRAGAHWFYYPNNQKDLTITSGGFTGFSEVYRPLMVVPENVWKTNNYDSGSEEFKILRGTINGEAGPGADAYAVALCILNRKNSGKWGGSTLTDVCTASGQFAAYFNKVPNYIAGYSGKNVSSTVQKAAELAAAGDKQGLIDLINKECPKAYQKYVPNIVSFRSKNSGSSWAKYGTFQVVSSGNKYGIER